MLSDCLWLLYARLGSLAYLLAISCDDCFVFTFELLSSFVDELGDLNELLFGFFQNSIWLVEKLNEVWLMPLWVFRAVETFDFLFRGVEVWRLRP